MAMTIKTIQINKLDGSGTAHSPNKSKRIRKSLKLTVPSSFASPLANSAPGLRPKLLSRIKKSAKSTHPFLLKAAGIGNEKFEGPCVVVSTALWATVSNVDTVVRGGD